MSKSTVTAVGPRDLREWFRADEKRLNRLSPEARKTVEPGARGKVHPEAISDHNTRRRTKVYTVGEDKARRAAKQAEREALREAGLLGDKARGPLNKAAREFLATSKG